MLMDKKKKNFCTKKEEEELLRFFHDACNDYTHRASTSDPRRYSIHLMFIEM